MIESTLYLCTNCGDNISMWEDESEHPCLSCGRWALQDTGERVDTMENTDD